MFPGCYKIPIGISASGPNSGDCSLVRRFFSPKVRKLEKKRFWSPNEKVL